MLGILKDIPVSQRYARYKVSKWQVYWLCDVLLASQGLPEQPSNWLINLFSNLHVFSA
jgi:hypothetical protein